MRSRDEGRVRAACTKIFLVVHSITGTWEWESGDVIEGPGRRAGGSREQEYSKRENAARPACRHYTYLTRNLYTPRRSIVDSNTCC